ncbi:hypothetical protein HRED_05129, partial [Candidatus Haloredivivus sp. G17]
MDEEVPDSVTEKTGNSAVTRLAIKMAHEKMQELQEERELKAKIILLNSTGFSPGSRPKTSRSPESLPIWPVKI